MLHIICGIFHIFGGVFQFLDIWGKGTLLETHSTLKDVKAPLWGFYVLFKAYYAYLEVCFTFDIFGARTLCLRLHIWRKALCMRRYHVVWLTWSKPLTTNAYYKEMRRREVASGSMHWRKRSQGKFVLVSQRKIILEHHYHSRIGATRVWRAL